MKNNRLVFIGNMVTAKLIISSDWVMPELYIPKDPSWAELQRGRQSKKDRRK